MLVKETGPSKADQATGARTSRYGGATTSDDSRPPPGWGPAEPEAPPPGWGTADSSSYGTRAPVARRNYDAPKKKKRKGGASAGAILGNLRVLAIVIVVGVLIFLGAKSQFGGESLSVALVTGSDVAVTGTFEVLDESENVIGSTEIGDAGSKCGSGRLSNFKVKAKGAKEYYFRYNGVTAGPLDAAAVKANDRNVTINETTRGLVATTDRPRACL
ncbi:MAG: hypothetical protein DCC49_02325 [Acidobacteria bacterium]|nr:MAG: hypothetical protein DCC49_02325 [Acidobacteriota bacterium]